MRHQWFAQAAPRARTFNVYRMRDNMRHVYDYEYYVTPGCHGPKAFRTLAAAGACAEMLNAREHALSTQRGDGSEMETSHE